MDTSTKTPPSVSGFSGFHCMKKIKEKWALRWTQVMHGLLCMPAYPTSTNRSADFSKSAACAILMQRCTPAQLWQTDSGRWWSLQWMMVNRVTPPCTVHLVYGSASFPGDLSGRYLKTQSHFVCFIGLNVDFTGVVSTTQSHNYAQPAYTFWWL